MKQFYEQLSQAIVHFHWLRPLWLLTIIPVVVLAVFLWKLKRHAHQWQQMIAPELLPFLLDGKTIQPRKSLVWALLLAWIITTIALAGPSWMKRPTPVEKNQNALVILLDLSISMISEDVKPSRLARARLKIADILRERKDGQTALVVYAGEAHTVTPLSDDSATMLSLLPTLEPGIMPLQGSNTEDAIARGIQLLHDAGATQGDLLLITDGVVPAAFPKIHSLLSSQKINLNILGVGTEQAAPIPSSNGGFLRDRQGAIITAALNSAELNQLAQSIGGRYKEIANNDSDIHYLIPRETAGNKNKPTLEHDFDQWFDQGHWLVFLLLPIVLASFRRGFILMLMCCPLLIATPKSAYAFELSDLGLTNIWTTQDQQAAKKFQQGDAKAAAEIFNNQDWKAAAEYRAGNYAAAAEDYAKSDTAAAHYNRGNALAKLGKLDDAIKAYDDALKRDPALDDAKKNSDLVKKIKQQQDQKNDQKNSDKHQKNDNDKQDNNNPKNDDNQKNQDSKNDEQKKQDQQQSQTPNNNEQKESRDKQKENNNEQSNSELQDQKSSAPNQQQNSSTSGVNASEQNQQANTSSTNAQQAQQQSANSSVGTSAINHAGQQQSSTDDNKSDEKDSPQQTLDASKLTPEQQQALEQWLRRVPDDPGGLLRNKFKWQYLQNRQKKIDGDFESPENKADQRW